MPSHQWVWHTERGHGHAVLLFHFPRLISLSISNVALVISRRFHFAHLLSIPSLAFRSSSSLHFAASPHRVFLLSLDVLSHFLFFCFVFCFVLFCLVLACLVLLFVCLNCLFAIFFHSLHFFTFPVFLHFLPLLLLYSGVGLFLSCDPSYTWSLLSLIIRSARDTATHIVNAGSKRLWHYL